MRVFVTGATGYIRSEVVRELINAGHKVIGLTRSDDGALKLKEAGAEVHKGSVDDLDSLRSGATIAAFDMPRSSVQTQELLNWRPVHPTLISDLEQWDYFKK